MNVWMTNSNIWQMDEWWLDGGRSGSGGGKEGGRVREGGRQERGMGGGRTNFGKKNLKSTYSIGMIEFVSSSIVHRLSCSIFTVILWAIMLKLSPAGNWQGNCQRPQLLDGRNMSCTRSYWVWVSALPPGTPESVQLKACEMRKGKLCRSL